MSDFKRTGKYKESPYYGGSYLEAKKRDKQPPHDSKNLYDNKPPTLGTHLSVMKFTKNNPFKHDPSSGEGSKVQHIVSSLDKASSWGFKDSKKTSLTNTVILEEDPQHEENETSTFDAFNTRFRSDEKGDIDGLTLSNGSSGVIFPPTKPSYNSFEAKPQSLGDMVARPCTDSKLLKSNNLSFKSLVIVNGKDHDRETESHMQGSLPLESHSHKHTRTMELQGCQDTSMQVSSAKDAPSFRRSMDDRSSQGDLHKEDLIESKSDDGQVTNSGNKDHQRAFRFTGTDKDEKIFLSGVASAFYSGGSLSLHGILACTSINKINEFLDERRDDLHAGVPGKWLTIVLGRESSELSTIVATIMHSYFLSLTTKQDQLCIVPLINMARADLALNPDVTWLFTSIGLRTSSLLFLDEINLSYFHRFGSLRLVLVNHMKLCPSQENFKDDVEEILAIHDQVPDVGSSCTLIAESYTKHQPELLAGRAISRLLLAGILLDTKNLTTETTTSRDVSMATLLLNGAGQFGRNGLFKILKQKSHDLSSMHTNELLRKQFKKLKFGSSGEKATGENSQQYEESVGMSSLPIPLSEVLVWEEDSLNTIAHFPGHMGLSFFVLVTGYYETKEIFKREVLLVIKDDQSMENLSNFILSNNATVKFVPMLMPGLPSCIRGFFVEGKRISRNVIVRIIEDYFSR